MTEVKEMTYICRTGYSIFVETTYQCV